MNRRENLIHQIVLIARIANKYYLKGTKNKINDDIETLSSRCRWYIAKMDHLDVKKKIQNLEKIKCYSMTLKGKIGYDDFKQLKELCDKLDAEIVLIALEEY